MALDRYDRTARVNKSISFDTASSRQALAASQSLESRLDSISNYIYKGLEKQKTEEGLQYGVTKRPTLEQIESAVSSEQDPSELFVEGGTVFGDAAREAQAELYRQDLEYDITNYFNNIMSGIKAGAPIDDPQEIARDMQGKIDAASTILRDVSPTQNIKFRQGTSAIGNKIYGKINEVYIERMTAENQEKFNNGINAFGTNFYDELRNVNADGKQGNLIEAELYMSIHEKRLNKLINYIPGAVEANKQLIYDTKQLAYKEATLDYILEELDKPDNIFIKDGKNFLEEINKGNVGDFSAVYQLMDLKQRNELETAIINRITNRASAFEKIEKANEDANNTFRVDTLFAYSSNAINPSTKKPWEGIDVIKVFTKKGIKISDSLITSLTKPSTETDMTIKNEAELAKDLTFGKKSEEDIFNAATTGKITWKGYARLLDDYTNITTKIKPGLDEIKRALAIENINEFALIPLLTKPIYATLTGQLNIMAKEAAQKGDPFNAYRAAQSIISEFEVTQIANNIKDALNELNLLLNTTEPITVDNYYLYDTPDELIVLGIESRDIRDKIGTQINILKNQEQRIGREF